MFHQYTQTDLHDYMEKLVRQPLSETPREATHKPLPVHYSKNLTFKPHFNFAPTQNCNILTRSSTYEVQLAKWGFEAKVSRTNTRPGEPSHRIAHVINARIETAHQKPLFKSAFLTRHCAVLVSGYFEWQTTAAQAQNSSPIKQPYCIRPANFPILALAGIWNPAAKPQTSNESTDLVPHFCLLTTQATSLTQEIHDRMPLLLDQEKVPLWLDQTPQELLAQLENSTPEENSLVKILQANPSQEKNIKVYAVSKLVNSPKNNLPQNIVPIAISQPSN
jgi:putative SOS response-associated peptidase YedK